MYKVGPYLVMREQNVGNAEVARRLGCHMPPVGGTLDVQHRSWLDVMDVWPEAVGRRLHVTAAIAPDPGGAAIRLEKRRAGQLRSDCPHVGAVRELPAARLHTALCFTHCGRITRYPKNVPHRIASERVQVRILLVRVSGQIKLLASAQTLHIIMHH